jgi:hypothetical protein
MNGYEERSAWQIDECGEKGGKAYEFVLFQLIGGRGDLEAWHVFLRGEADYRLQLSLISKPLASQTRHLTCCLVFFARRRESDAYLRLTPSG